MKIIASAVICLVFAGCNCGPGPDRLPDGGFAGGAGAGGGSNTAGGTNTAGGSNTAGGTSNASDGGNTCAAVTSQATLSKKPIDILMTIDNSGSMGEEIKGVQDNINANFAAVVGAGGVDYRVILISRHGSDSAIRVCITAPLSGNASCSPPPQKPTNSTRFFHYDTTIDSFNSLQVLLATYDRADMNNFAPTGWREWMRPDANRVIVDITDDNSKNLGADPFETQLFAKTTLFGTALKRNYVFHGIIGVKAKANPAEPYLANEPLLAPNEKCRSAVNSGPAYQPLAMRTGGLRFPLCDPNLYNAVFKTIADSVVASSKVSCDFTLPALPPGFTMFNKIIVNYTPGDVAGPVHEFTKVGSAAACNATGYTLSATQVTLCPMACAAVQSDTKAKIDLNFTCEPEIN
jgi:hypothetical protein